MVRLIGGGVPRPRHYSKLKLVKVYLRVVIASGGQMEFYGRSCDDSHIHILHTTYTGISLIPISDTGYRDQPSAYATVSFQAHADE